MVAWNWERDDAVMKLPWTIQAIPVGDDRFIFVVWTDRMRIRSIFRWAFGLDAFLDGVDDFCEVLKSLNMPGPLESQAPFPADSLSVMIERGLVDPASLPGYGGDAPGEGEVPGS
jgi:hypothetical protein